MMFFSGYFVDCHYFYQKTLLNIVEMSHHERDETFLFGLRKAAKQEKKKNTQS